MIDLDAIKARCAAATPGPWEAGDRYHLQGASHCGCLPAQGPLVWEGVTNINGTRMKAHLHRRDEPWWPYGITARVKDGAYEAVLIETEEYGTMRQADLEFVAHAREDVPALVAEVERLRDLITDADSLCSLILHREHDGLTDQTRIDLSLLVGRLREVSDDRRRR